MPLLYSSPTSSAAQLFSWRRLARAAGLTALLATAGLGAQAQSLNYTSAAVLTGRTTYTDLAATGTAIATANTDDANSAPQNIGFTFNYNGQIFTQFVLNTNGYLRLGADAPSTDAYYTEAQSYTGGPLASANAADVNLLLPFNVDLTAGTSPTEYRVAVAGTAPNRTCTIQWKNVSDKEKSSIATQYSNFSFQVRLFENGIIDFVYSVPVAGTGAAAFKAAAVGLKGSGSADDQVVVAQKASAQAWANPTFLSRNYTNDNPPENRFNFRSNVAPVAGQTYRFVPALAQDGTVSVIYTLGQLPAKALPHTVQAVVENVGINALTNVTVTLAVTGANTFTSTKTITVARGAQQQVTFDPYPATLNAGLNDLKVTLANDDDPSDNTATYSQTVTASQIGYVDAALPIEDNGGISAEAASNQFGVKYTLNGPVMVNEVYVGFAKDSTSTAPYRVALYDATGANGTPGARLYISSVLARTGAEGVVTVPITPTQVPATFYAAVIEQSDANIALGYQLEQPLRPTTFLIQLPGGAWQDLNNFGLPLRLDIGVGFATTLAVNQALSQGIDAYPNPTTGLLTLDLRSLKARQVQATLINSLGQTVLTRTFSNQQQRLDLSNLAAGIYSLKLNIDGETAVKRISVQR